MKILQVAIFGVISACVCAPVVAQTVYGDWTVGVTEDKNLYAGTSSDSGSTLMKMCDPAQGICKWFLLNYTSCESGERYPALFTSSIGAHTVDLYCHSSVTSDGRKIYRYIINDYEGMDKLVAATGNLGIAMAAKDGRFLVYRFSMRGATQAERVLREGALRIRNSGKGDTVL